MTDEEHLSRTSPIYRALWEQAHLWYRTIDPKARPEAMPVIELRNMLVRVYEAGAQRRIAQARAIDDALAEHAVHSGPRSFVVPLTEPPA